MFKVQTSSTFHVKILESHWRTNAAGPCLSPQEQRRTGSLCTSLSRLESGFTCTDRSLAGFRNFLFLLNVMPPNWTTYDLSESFSVQVPCFHVWFLRRGCDSHFRPALATPRSVWHGSLFSWRLSTELWFTVGRSRLSVVGKKVRVLLDISLWARLSLTPSVGVLR